MSPRNLTALALEAATAGNTPDAYCVISYDLAMELGFTCDCGKQHEFQVTLGEIAGAAIAALIRCGEIPLYNAPADDCDNESEEN